jgi:polyisoprenoid-binding protein YceI
MHAPRLLAALVLAPALALAAAAAPITFDFRDPKRVNNIVFQLDAPLESINGTGNGISGTATFDPANPAAVTGKITLAVNSMVTPNGSMTDHLKGDRWLDAATHPEITFEIVRTENPRTSGNDTQLDVTGLLTVKGVTREITVPVRLTYLPGMLRARGGIDADGDILVVRSNFTIQRDQFGINAGQNLDRVANDINISLALAGLAPR